MKRCDNKLNFGFLIALAIGVLTAFAQAQPSIPTGNPAATIDLATNDGATLVKGEWRYSDTRITERRFQRPRRG